MSGSSPDKQEGENINESWHAPLDNSENLCQEDRQEIDQEGPFETALSN